MTALEQVKQMLSNLSPKDLLELGKEVDKMQERCKPEREVVACPHCGSINTVKYGYTNAGTPRYKCKDCKGGIFTQKTNKLFSHSHLKENQLYEVVAGMIDGLTLQQTADKANISVKSAWYNTRKIESVLLAQGYNITERFNNKVECDEIFSRLSFKGKKDPDFFIETLGRMPRHGRKHEEKEEYLRNNGFSYILWDQIELERLLYRKNYLPGTNRDAVCILTGRDTDRQIYMNPVCLGHIESKDIIQHLGRACFVTSNCLEDKQYGMKYGRIGARELGKSKEKACTYRGRSGCIRTTVSFGWKISSFHMGNWTQKTIG